MRILVVVPYYEPAFLYGGPVRSVPLLCRAIARAGAQVIVFTTDANGTERLNVPTDRPVLTDGVEVHYFRRAFGERFFYSAALGRACRRSITEFDLVHCSTLWTYPGLAAAAACRHGGVPRIESPRGALLEWALHHHYWKKWPFLALFARRDLNTAAAIHCTDATEQADIVRLGLRPETFVVPNPVDVTQFQSLPPRGDMRARLGIPQEAVVSLFLGRLNVQKGLDVTINAFAKVAAAHPNAYLVIAGGPDEDGSGENAKVQAAGHGLGNRVMFIGPVMGSDRLAVLADSDLFVLTSHSESFGMAAAEAMAAGLPVLLSDQVGVARDAAGAGAACVVPLEVPRIASAWVRMLADPEGTRALASRARIFARKQYDADAVARRMLDAYLQVVGHWKGCGIRS